MVFFPCNEMDLNTTAEFFAPRDRARHGSTQGGASHLTLWPTDVCSNSCCDPSTSNRPETPHTAVSELESEIRPVVVNPSRNVYFHLEPRDVEPTTAVLSAHPTDNTVKLTCSTSNLSQMKGR